MTSKKSFIEAYIDEFARECNNEIKGTLDQRVAGVMKTARYRLYQEIFKTESVEEILMIIAGIYGKEAFYDAICKLKAYEYADKSIELSRAYRSWKVSDAVINVEREAAEGYLKQYAKKYHICDGPDGYNVSSVLNFIACIENYNEVISVGYAWEAIEALRDMPYIDWKYVIKKNPNVLKWYALVGKNEMPNE